MCSLGKFGCQSGSSGMKVDGLEAAEIERLLAADKLDAGMVR
jgi:hypothetical protein